MEGLGCARFGRRPPKPREFCFLILLLFFLVRLHSACERVTAVQTLLRPNWVVMLSALLACPYFWGGEAGGVAQSLGSK